MKSNRFKTFVKYVAVSLLGVVLGLTALSLFVNNYNPHNHPRGFRIHSDLRSLSTAIDCYYFEHRTLPYSVPIKDYCRDYFHLDQEYLNDDLASRNGLHIKIIFPGSDKMAGLTTPIAYTTSIYPDHCAEIPGLPFSYACTESRYVLYSPGPDLIYDIQLPELMLEGGTMDDAKQRFSNYSYDPSNGTISGGDKWRLGPRETIHLPELEDPKTD